MNIAKISSDCFEFEEDPAYAGRRARVFILRIDEAYLRNFLPTVLIDGYFAIQSQRTGVVVNFKMTNADLKSKSFIFKPVVHDSNISRVEVRMAKTNVLR